MNWIIFRKNDFTILPFGDFARNSQHFFCFLCSLCNFSLAILPSDELYDKTQVPDKRLLKIMYKFILYIFIYTLLLNSGNIVDICG